jgi:hypothetical protein
MLGWAQPIIAIQCDQETEICTEGVPPLVVEKMLSRGFALKRFGHNLCEVRPGYTAYTVLSYNPDLKHLRAIHVPSTDPLIAMMRARECGQPIAALTGYHDARSFIQLTAQPLICSV